MEIDRILSTYLDIWFMAAGALIGSYIITIWSRWRRGVAIVKIISWRNAISPKWKDKIWTFPTSRCFSCEHLLRTRDVIPIVSYIRYRGRCKYCGVPIGRGTILCEGMGLLVGLTIAILV